MEKVDVEPYLGQVVQINYRSEKDRVAIGEVVEITESAVHLKTKDERNSSVAIDSIISMWEVEK